VKLSRAGTGGAGTTPARPRENRFHVFCVTTAAASAAEDERVAGCKARGGFTTPAADRTSALGLTINTAAGLYETRERSC